MSDTPTLSPNYLEADLPRPAKILVRLPEPLRRRFYVACRLNGRSANATLLLLIEQHIAETQNHTGATIGVKNGTAEHQA